MGRAVRGRSLATVERQVVGDLLLLLLARLAPRDDDEPRDLVHHAPAERAPPLRQRVQHALRDIERPLHQLARRASLRDAIREREREVDAVFVEDVVVLRLPRGLELVQHRLQFVRTHGRGAEVEGDLWPIAEHLLHHRHRARLDMVGVEVLVAMHANADVRDEWQLLGDRRRQHVGQRPADLVQRRQHARRIGRRLSADSGHLVDAPELRQEGGALRGRRRRVRTDVQP
mmetsp:Transcript_16793/g.42439  ORF Transcript_16793/g.42439 Transcript_16793/m.42439 type:complete len:230 (-) Transcript_16793:145-834(-)